MSFTQNLFSTESISRLAQSFIQNYRRFPLTMLCSLVVTGLLFYLFRVEALDHEINELNQWRFVQLTMILSLGIPLFFSVEIKSNARKYLYYLPIIAFLGIFAWSADWDSKDVNQYFVIRFVAFSLMSHLVVAFLPFLLPINQKINGFWQYNKTLFIRILTAFIYTVTLFLGLSLALVGIEQLFDVGLPRNAYLYLFIFLNVFCNTHFFVSGIPNPVEELEQNQEYPKGLKYFSQYVLLALVAIYMVILFVYEFKIIATWNLPRGWVSVLVIACSVFGILAFLLLYPLRNENSWIKRYTKAFYYVLLPLLGLLVVAIYVRVNEYGITEPRYFVILLALWLLGITLYFIISKTDNIKMIPISLAVLAFLSVFGPWGAFSTSDRSQFNRLYAVLEKGNFLKDGKMMIPKTQKLDSIQSEVISSVLDYFSKKRNLRTIQPLFKEDLNGLDSLNQFEIKNKLVAYSGGFELSKQNNQEPKLIFSSETQSNNNNIEFISGYDYYIELNNINSNEINNFEKLGKVKLNNENILELYEGNFISALINFDNIFQKIKVKYKRDDNYNIPKHEMTFENDVEKWRIKLQISQIQFNFSGKVEGFDGILLLKRK